MFFGVVVFHVIVAVSLILVVLMQSSKGEALSGGAFGGSSGGGGSFGGARVPFLSKVTTVLAVIFMLNCIALTLLSSQSVAVAGGQQDPNARSIVTEKMQKEIQANQAAAGTQFDTSATTEDGVNLDDLIKVEDSGDSVVTEAAEGDSTQSR